MLLTWIHLILIFVFVPADTMYFTGFTKQHITKMKFLFKDLDFCMRVQVPLSLSSGFKKHLICIEKQLFHCLLRGIPNSEKRFGQLYCGAISLNQHEVVSSDILLFIEVIKGHILHHEVLKFNFRTSPIISCGAHGLTVSYKGYISMNFCGRRVPWTMIVSSDKSYLHLVIQKYLHYEISIFYSSLNKDWIRHFLYIRLLYSLNETLIYKKATKNFAHYYIATENNKHIYLNLLIRGRLNGSIIVKDGPGRLSNTILDLHNTNSSENAVTKTSAFWAFVEIYLVDIEIELRFVESTHIDCYHRGQIDIQQTSKYRKNEVCAIFIQVRRVFLRLTVKNFVFDGPDKLTGLSSSLCQYGGLYVKFDYADRGFEYCQDINDLDIYSQHDVLYITLVWFYGYSSGYFTGAVDTTDCQTLYIEHDSPDFVYQHDVTVKLWSPPNCHVAVCPPMHSETQKSCTVKLGLSSLGPTSLKIKTINTLQPCDTRVRHRFASYELDVNYATKWPFGLVNTTSISRKLYDNNTNVHNFDFLHFAKVKMTLMCIKDSPRKQIAVLVMKSVCESVKLNFLYSIVNNIPALSDSCLQISYQFVAVKRQKKLENNHHHFIYKGDGHITTGHKIIVCYKSCPTKCRSFNYSVFVKSAHDKTVIEYTTQVGHDIFTGYYHRGFSVHINLPENDCRKEICHLSLSIHKSKHQIGTDHYKKLNRSMPFFPTNKR